MTRESYVQSLFGQEILRFTYAVIGIRDLSADDYLKRNEPFASAFSAFMRVSKEGRVTQKVRSMQTIAISEENDARKVMQANVVERYLKLNEAEQTDYARRAQENDAKEIGKMVDIFEERGIVKSGRKNLLKVLRRKFGEVPEPLTAQIEAIAAADELDALFDRALDAASLPEFIAGFAP